MSADVLVRHDWTYGELLRLATMAARRTSAMGDDFAEKQDIAMLAIVELLWAHDERPAQWVMVDHASDAVRAHVRRDMAQHGKNKWGDWAPHHRTYWLDHHDHDPATDRIVETLALQQVYAALDQDAQEILWTRAMFPMSKDAAGALGIDKSLFSRRHREARRKAHALWYGDETAPSIEGTRDRRALSTGTARRTTNRRRLTRAKAVRS